MIKNVKKKARKQESKKARKQERKEKAKFKPDKQASKYKKRKMRDYANTDINSTNRQTQTSDVKKSKPLNLSSYKFLLIFCVLIVLTAQALIMTTQLARNKQFELQVLDNSRQELQIEKGRLLLEKGALTSPARVEKIAREKLKMHFPKSNEIEIISK